MISEMNINKLYEIIISGKELTTSELNNCGFKSNDLVKLINDGVILRVRRGLYKLVNVDGLFYYGKSFVSSNSKKADLCFRKCLMLDPKHIGASLHFFFINIQNKDYEESFQYLDNLLNAENDFYVTDFNYYLYLLSVITEVPDKHREYVRYLNYDDIKLSANDKRTIQNKIRFTVMQGKYAYALRQLNDLMEKSKRASL